MSASLRRLLPLLSFSFLASGVMAQCQNSALYPPNPITPDPGGALTTITSCNYQTEYARITGIVAGASYQFTIADGSYITVRKGLFNGPVLDHGVSPQVVTVSTNEDLFVHWNVNAACSTAISCVATTVQRFLDCAPPEVVAEVVNDCDNEQFNIQVYVATLGDASSVSFAYTVNNGPLNLQSNVATGTYALGPFAFGSVVDLTAVHGDNAACNIVFADLTNFPCLNFGCGPASYSHCYGNNEVFLEYFQGDSEFPLSLIFNAGAVSASGGDVVTIYDGLDELSPILYTGFGNAGNLTGISVVSTNPEHGLLLKLTSSGSWSCQDGVISPAWSYTVGCMDCSAPAASAGAVVTDCEEQQFTVPVNVTSLGSSSQLSIGNTAGVPPTVVNAPGVHNAGPFPLGSVVSLTVLAEGGGLCNVALGSFQGSGCPFVVQCPGDPVYATYCYTDDDYQEWLYQSSGTQPLALTFTAGTIESVAWDHITIHDGVDASAPVIWQHTASNTIPLAGIQAIATGPAIFMTMSSDGSISCAGGSTQILEWAWNVGCLDCTSPVASFNVLEDCLHHGFQVEVSVTDLGSSSSVRLVNSLNTDTVQNVGLGATYLGPFYVNEVVQISVLNADNALCRDNSLPLAFQPDSCIITACDPTFQTYCYADADTAWFVYQSGIAAPITLAFSAGQLLEGDWIELYNGPDATAQLVYQGNYGGNLTGLSLTSNNPDNALTLRVVSDASGSCDGGGTTGPLQWNVGCGLAGLDEMEGQGLDLAPNPTTGVVAIRLPRVAADIQRVDVLDVTGREVLRVDDVVVRGAWATVDLESLPNGRYHLRMTTRTAVLGASVLKMH